jgi:hypothetical protein
MGEWASLLKLAGGDIVVKARNAMASQKELHAKRVKDRPSNLSGKIYASIDEMRLDYLLMDDVVKIKIKDCRLGKIENNGYRVNCRLQDTTVVSYFGITGKERVKELLAHGEEAGEEKCKIWFVQENSLLCSESENYAH